jgi:hypothetical protein
MDKKAIIAKLNDATYELVLCLRAEINEDLENANRHKNNAGRALYECYENALKNHISEKGDKDAQYRAKNGYKRDSLTEDFNNWKQPLEDDFEDKIDYDLLKKIGSEINGAKHDLKELKSENLKKFHLHLTTLVSNYIESKGIKSISDYEKIDLPAWDTFYSLCNKFSEQEANYVLVISDTEGIDKAYLESLGIPKWSMIIDFDYHSRERGGFFNEVFSSKEPQPRVINVSDSVDIDTFSTYYQQHYHYFINGYQGSGVTFLNDFEKWSRANDKKFDALVSNFATKFNLNTKLVFVSYNLDEEFIEYIGRKFRQYLADNVSCIFAIQDDTNFKTAIKRLKASYCPISIPQIAEGIANFSLNFGTPNPYQDKYIVPHNEETNTADVSGFLSVDFYSSLENDFEVLHKGLDTQRPDIEPDKRDFLRGFERISWFGLRQDWDIKHPSLKKIEKTIADHLRAGKGKLYLTHEAGFGGTTIARRLAWNFHNEYPTLILKEYRGRITVDNIIKLHTQTRKTILVIIEIPQAINFDDVDNFYKAIGGATRPVVFLIVCRQGWIKNSNVLSISDWGNNIFDLVTPYKPYLKEYNNPNLEAQKEKELDIICNGTDAGKKNPFYVGLVTFEENFFAIKDFIRNFVNELINKEVQKKIVLYLAICHDYQGKALPSTFFRNVIKASNNDDIKLDNYLETSSLVSSLLVSSKEGKITYWQPRHALFSKELKEQILRGNDADNQDIWKQNLANYCIQLVKDSSTEEITSAYISELLQELFIGTRKDRAGDAFTKIVRDIPNNEDKEKLFNVLVDTYPENPHFCSHLARFYAYQRRNSEKAFEYADKAIRLSESEGFQDPILYHIKGMCLREAAYDKITRLKERKRKGNFIIQDDLQKVTDDLIPRAEREFERSRQIARQVNRIDEHGYIAHIQMLIQVIDFGAFMSGKEKGEFLSENKQPYADWLDIAETLLEEVKRISINEEDSSKVAECEFEMHKLYENYGLMLQALRNQIDLGKNIYSNRRKLVRTYIRKENESFSQNKRIISEILTIMEKNIVDEPSNEKNFYLWFRAARYSDVKILDAISKLANWRANSSVVDSLYYFYILKVISAIQEGSTADANDACTLIKECKAKAPKSQNLTTCFEWYGKGKDLGRLVSKIDFDDSNKDDKLELVSGYFTDYKHNGDGIITIGGVLEVFFSPVQAKLTEDDKGKKVEFYLGFSYDGLRADSFSVRIAGSQPRNKDIIQNTVPISELIKEKQDIQKIETKSEKLEGLKIVGKIELETKPKKTEGLKIDKTTTEPKILKGTVVDLKYPPNYAMGYIEADNGKRFFFHKDNEDIQVFNKLVVNKTRVSFEVTTRNEKTLAVNLKIID